MGNLDRLLAEIVGAIPATGSHTLAMQNVGAVLLIMQRLKAVEVFQRALGRGRPAGQWTIILRHGIS